MKFSFAPRIEKAEKSGLLIVPFWEGPDQAAEANRWEFATALQDFKGKLGETLLLYFEERVLLLGLGKPEDASAESFRRAYAAAVRVANQKKLKSINVLFPKTKLKKEVALRGIAEGILLANYAFTKLKQDNSTVLIEKICWVGLEPQKELARILTVAEGVEFVRDLVNGNSDDKPPKIMAEIARELEKRNPKVKTTILDEKKIEAEKMGLLLAVNRASSHEPYLVLSSYKGDPKSKEHIVLVGKGITYDTGGLQIKPPDNMMLMKSDMAGAATVLTAVSVAAELGLKVNVTAVAPLAENCIGSKSYKLGDVYRSMAGKTVEVNNTDAEGRLVLADAMTYALKHLKPTCMVDIATLTGSVIVGIGEDIAGLFANDEKVAKDLQAASDETGDLIWRLPLHADYRDALKSEYGDLLNTGGRDGGPIKAALFLQEFAGSIPWAHIDMGGPAYVTKPKHYHTTKATGFGLRLLVEFLERRAR